MTHIRIEPATVHFDGGPLDGTGVTDGDDRVRANATARLVCISTDNGERVPWAVKSAADHSSPAQAADDRYRVERSDYVEGRLHIWCSYDGPAIH